MALPGQFREDHSFEARKRLDQQLARHMQSEGMVTVEIFAPP